MRLCEWHTSCRQFRMSGLQMWNHQCVSAHIQRKQLTAGAGPTCPASMSVLCWGGWAPPGGGDVGSDPDPARCHVCQAVRNPSQSMGAPSVWSCSLFSFVPPSSARLCRVSRSRWLVFTVILFFMGELCMFVPFVELWFGWKVKMQLRTVLDVTVVDVQKRRNPSKHYVSFSRFSPAVLLVVVMMLHWWYIVVHTKSPPYMLINQVPQNGVSISSVNITLQLQIVIIIKKANKYISEAGNKEYLQLERMEEEAIR